MRVAVQVKPAVARGALLVVGASLPAEAEALAASGARVKTLESFAEAAEQLAVWRPTLVLVDDHLAWGDLEATQAFLRACRSTVPVSLLVGESVPTELLEACDAEGLVDCLPRPVAAAALAARLERLLGADARPVLAARRAPRTVLLLGDAPELERELPEYLWHVGYRLASSGPVAAGVDAVVCAGTTAVKADEVLATFLQERARARLPVPRVLSFAFEGASRGPAGCGVLVRQLDVLLDRAPYLLRPERRAPFVFPVRFREAGGATPGPWQSGYSWAVSPAGVFVRSLAPLRAGVALEAVVQVTTSKEELPLTGMVAWHFGWPADRAHRHLVGFGLQFLGPPLTARLAELIRLCTAEAPLHPARTR